ncbi:MAG: T9SS type A sorting domain-containing protein [Hymenobacter sp.]|nr:MAG: T9SS type A sorting domain-containing protein [Hymenobacter sp.]
MTSGNYVLIGKYTNPRGFGDAGLLSMYAASTATKVYIFIGGTVEANGNAFQLFMKLPGSTGVPVGTALPAATGGTSLSGNTSKMDMAVTAALALRGSNAASPSTFYVEGASYTNATTGASAKLSTTNFAGDGTAVTIPTTTGYTMFTSARTAYKNTTSGGVAANPGNVTPNTSANYGGAGSFGWEIELDRTAAGLTGATPLTLFVLQNSGAGNYISSDFIPQTSSPLTTNSGNLATGSFDFTTLAGLQYATVNIAAAGGTTLGTKAADAAALGLSVFPNPVQATSTVAYQVTGQATNVKIALTDLLGRTVRTVENGVKPVGAQTATLNTADVAAGTYLVRVQVGEQVATSKIAVL